MARRIVQELTEQQSLILRQAADRVMDARSVVAHEDAIYKALLGMIYPPGTAFDPTFGHGVFYIDEVDEGVPVEDFMRLMDDDEDGPETDYEGSPDNARVEGGDPLDDGDEG